MKWILSGGGLGALGALFKHLQWPYALWLDVAGIGIVAAGLFFWLNSSGGRNSHDSSESLEGSWWDSNSDSSGDCDGGGCGGD